MVAWRPHRRSERASGAGGRGLAAATVIEGPAVGRNPALAGDGEERRRARLLSTPEGAGRPRTVALHAGGAAAGVLLPRAPRRFALRHRDGTTRLATLELSDGRPGPSGRRLRAVAARAGQPGALGPGLRPGPASWRPLRPASPAVGHGDLSTKNVLWSLQRGPGGVRPRLRQLRALRTGWRASHALRATAGHDAQLGRPGRARRGPIPPWSRTATRWR